MSRSRTPPAFDDLGISRQRVAEWREIRDAGESTVEAAIRRALDEGHAPTKALILGAARTIRAERADEKRAARTERERTLAGKIVAFPDRRYGVLYADPPWRFEPWSRETGMDRAADNHYPTMSFEALCRATYSGGTGLCAVPMGDGAL